MTSKSLKLPDYYSACSGSQKEMVGVPCASLPVSGAATKGHLNQAILAENSLLQHAIEVNWNRTYNSLASLSCLKTMENIPPTADALLQPTKQVACPNNLWTNSQDFQQKWPKAKSWR